MIQTRASTRRRSSRPAHKPAAPRPPALNLPLDAALRACSSEWWERAAAGLRELQRHGAAGAAFTLGENAAEAALGRDPVSLLDRPRVAAFLGALERAPLPCMIECRLGDARAPRWVRLTVLQSTGEGRARIFGGVLTDITATKKLEKEILQINEREQNRIGQELHDDLCQVLAGLSCLTRVLENRLAPQLPHEADNLREINQQLVEAMDRTRALTHGLYPAKMRSGDARAALLELAKQVEVRFGVKVRTAFSGRFPAHAAQEILQVYRIAQEAISNALRHGRATAIELALSCRGETMQLRVRDNGTGFPKKESPRPGIGLQIMQHRAAQLGAQLRIGNAPRHGALVELHYHPVAQL